MPNPTRREVLAGTTGLGATALAGCVSGGSDDDGGDPDGNETTENGTDERAGGANETTENGTDERAGGTNETGDDSEGSQEEAEQPLELRESSLRVESVDVGVEDRVEASVEGSTLVVDGMMPVPTPCHTAVLGNVTLDDGRLAVVLEGQRESEDAERPCAGAVSSASYDLRLEFSRELATVETFEAVTVDHGGSTGQRHVLVEGSESTGAAAGDVEPDGAVVETAISSQSSCAGGSERAAPAVDIAGQEVTITGSFGAPNPCYEATLGGASLDGGLSVAVGAEPPDPDVVCVQCLGSVRYEVTVVLADGVELQPEEVVVDEPSGGHRGEFELPDTAP
jgi:hypothetical protein